MSKPRLRLRRIVARLAPTKMNLIFTPSYHYYSKPTSKIIAFDNQRSQPCFTPPVVHERPGSGMDTLSKLLNDVIVLTNYIMLTISGKG